MRILCIGDVVGAAGCDHLRRVLPGIKRMYGIDVCVVNGENAAEGNGLLPQSAAHIFDSGADVITTGNHVFRRRELYETLDREPLLLRPANYPSSAPGRGSSGTPGSQGRMNSGGSFHSFGGALRSIGGAFLRFCPPMAHIEWTSSWGKGHSTPSWRRPKSRSRLRIRAPP